MIRRAPLLAFGLVLVAAAAAPPQAEAASKAAAKGGACQGTRWTLTLPAGSSDASAVIMDGQESRIWRVGVGAVPAQAQLVIEYKAPNGTGGEVVLLSGAAELVDGSSVSMHLRRGSAGSGKITVSGLVGPKCGK
jgi:hypothetical protein